MAIIQVRSGSMQVPSRSGNSLTSQAAPFRRATPEILWRQTRGLNRAFVILSRFLRLPQTLQRLPVIVKPFGIIGPFLFILQEFVASVLILTRRDVKRSQLAQNLALTMALVLIHNGLKMSQRLR